MSEISIIGGGIAGLTTAIGLERIGEKVTVYERASEIRTVGAGIILASNAMQVYKKYGLENAIQNLGNPIAHINITDAQLKIISPTNLLPFDEKFQVSNVAIHRASLQQILIETLDKAALVLDKKLVAVSKSDSYQLWFEDNSCVYAKYLIGADGIHSQVRNLLFEKSFIRNAHQSCWRGIASIELPLSYRNQLIEAWGKGKRFGFVNIGQGKVYWYALTNKSPDNCTFHAKYYTEFHPLIQQIIAQTPEHEIFYTPIIDLEPIEQWHTDRVCLIGDAVHATTPNLGQGACQAIEDAYILSELLGLEKCANDAFLKYERLRKAKAHYVVNSSWKFGKLAQIENPLGIKLRNFILKATPESLQTKQLNKLYTLSQI